MQYLRLADDVQRNLLPLRNVREYEWVFVVTIEQIPGIHSSAGSNRRLFAQLKSS